MPETDIQRNISLRTVLTALAILALAAMVAFLQISEHRTPRPAFADQHLPGAGVIPSDAAIGGLISVNTDGANNQQVHQ